MRFYTKKDVFESHKRMKNELKDKGYKMPKDFDSYFENMLSKKSQYIIQKCTDYFNTVWNNNSLDDYMKAGFGCFKNFKYSDIMNDKVIRTYIKIDKNKKRCMDFDKRDFKESLKYFVLKHLPSLIDTPESHMNPVVKDYIDNKISGYFLTWLLLTKKINLTSNDMYCIPYVTDRYKSLRDVLLKHQEFLNKMEKIYEKFNR